MASIEKLDDDVFMTVMPHMKPIEIVNLLKAMSPAVKDSVMTKLSSSKRIEHMELYIEIYKAHFRKVDYDSALLHALSRKHTDIVQKICSVDRITGAHILVERIRAGDIEGVRTLLRYGADARGYPLIESVIKNKPEITQLLLDHGADERRDLSLTIAAANGCSEIVRILLAGGADANAMDSDALIKGVTREDIDMVRSLLAHGADVNARNNLPLRAAIKQNNVELILILLRAGAIVNDDVLRIANIAGGATMVSLVLQNRAK
jgi:ankyrin repeat protein